MPKSLNRMHKSSLQFLYGTFDKNKIICYLVACYTSLPCTISFLGYIKDFQVYDPHRVGRITVQLQGRINDCRALTYRQDIKSKDIEEYKIRALPTRQVCSLFVYEN